MITSLNDLKSGKTIIFNNQPHVILEANFVRMQQRKPVMQTKLRNLITNKFVEHTFKQGDKVEEADLEHAKASFLYKDHATANFMDGESYEQFSFPLADLGQKINYLKEGQEVTILKFNDRPEGVEIPPKVNLKVISCPPGIRGDTAQGSVTKEATLETGAVAKVPLFIKEGDIIRVNTESGEYVERVKE